MQSSDTRDDKVCLARHSVVRRHGPLLRRLVPVALGDASLEGDVTQKIELFCKLEKVILDFTLMAVGSGPPGVEEM